MKKKLKKDSFGRGWLGWGVGGEGVGCRVRVGGAGCGRGGGGDDKGDAMRHRGCSKISSNQIIVTKILVPHFLC